jgi:ArsR family transcriptional regulator
VLKPGGRVIAVDFAPHELEFLRDELNHRRLGFSDEEVKGWFRAAGLVQGATRAIAPDPDIASAKLTVKIWSAASQRTLQRQRAEALV